MELRAYIGCPVRVDVTVSSSPRVSALVGTFLVLDVFSVARRASRRVYWISDLEFPAGAWYDADVRLVGSLVSVLSDAARLVSGEGLRPGELLLFLSQLSDPAALALSLSIMDS